MSTPTSWGNNPGLPDLSKMPEFLFDHMPAPSESYPTEETGYEPDDWSSDDTESEPIDYDWSSSDDTESNPVKTDQELPPPPVREGVRLPTKGRPARVLNRNIRHRKVDAEGYLVVPEPTSEELAEWVLEYQQAATKDIIERTKRRMRQAQGGKVLVLGMTGGSGKTTLTTFLSARLSLDTRADVVYYDGNFAEGCGAERMGFSPGSTITVQELANSRDRYRWSREEFTGGASRSVHGVRCIASSPDDDDEGNIVFRRNDCREALEIIRAWSEFDYLDSMNKFTCEVGLEMIDQADVLIFAANERKQESLRRLPSMYERVRHHGFADKVDKSLTVITAHPLGLDGYGLLTHYGKYLDKLYDADGTVIETYEKYRGTLMGVPHNAHIETNMLVQPEQLDWYTDHALRQINLAALNALPDKREASDTSMLQWRNDAWQQFAEALPSDLRTMVLSHLNGNQQGGAHALPDGLPLTHIEPSALPSNNGWAQ